MMGRRSTIVVAVCVAAGCQVATHRDPTATAPARSCKPEAPVALELSQRAVAAGVIELRARAVPDRWAASLELGIVIPAHATPLGPTRAAFGATDPGEARTLAVAIRVDARASEVAAFARLPVDDIVMSRSARLPIGAPPPPAHARVYALPDGELARELRP